MFSGDSDNGCMNSLEQEYMVDASIFDDCKDEIVLDSSAMTGLPSEVVTELALSESSKFYWPSFSEPESQLSYDHNFHDASSNEISSPATGKELLTDDFAGYYGFDIIVEKGVEGHTKDYCYSDTLNMVFIDAEVGLQVNVMLRQNRTVAKGLYLRALLFFSNPSYFTEAVITCPNHRASPQVMHVVQSCFSGAEYHTDPVSGRHSVRVPLVSPQAGMQIVSYVYKFVCRHSCMGGIGRRHVKLLFTLENAGGEILGRRHLPVRVCRSPKRDMRKLEIANKTPLLPESLQQSETEEHSSQLIPNPPTDSSNERIIVETFTKHRAEIRHFAAALLRRDQTKKEDIQFDEFDRQLLSLYEEDRDVTQS